MARVEFQVGGNLVGTDTTAPYAIAWDSTNFANGTYAFTAKAVDMAGNSKTSASVNATVSNTSACSTTQQLVLNPGFESGQSNWISTTGVIASIPGNTRTGNYAAWLNGYGATSTDTLYQTVAIPATACAATYTFWLKITTAETTTTIAYDKLTVAVQNSAGTTLGTLASYSNLNKTGDYVQRSFNLLPYKGQTIRLHFRGVEDSSLATNFLIDDVALNIRK